MRKRRGAYRVSVGKLVGKRPLGRPRYRWEDNTNWILRKWDGARSGLIWLRRGTGDGVL
jgi:hypothetical protein